MGISMLLFRPEAKLWQFLMDGFMTEEKSLKKRLNMRTKEDDQGTYFLLSNKPNDMVAFKIQFRTEGPISLTLEIRAKEQGETKELENRLIQAIERSLMQVYGQNEVFAKDVPPQRDSKKIKVIWKS